MVIVKVKGVPLVILLKFRVLQNNGRTNFGSLPKGKVNFHYRYEGVHQVVCGTQALGWTERVEKDAVRGV